MVRRSGLGIGDAVGKVQLESAVGKGRLGWGGSLDLGCVRVVGVGGGFVSVCVRQGQVCRVMPLPSQTCSYPSVGF